MSKYKRVLIGLISVVFLLGGVTMITPLGSEAEGKEKKAKANHKGLQENHDGLQEAHRVLQGNRVGLEGQINAFGEDIEQIKEVLDELNLRGRDDSNHTLRWDTVLDSTNGSTETGAEGCNSDRFKCIMPTTAFPDGEAVLDLQTGQVWDRSPHDTRNDTDSDADDTQTWNDARFHCADRVMGGQRGNRLPSLHELNSLYDVNNTGGNPDLPPGSPFIDVENSSYWSATTRADNPTDAWVVRFFNGDVVTFNKTVFIFVWCVRGGHNDGSQY